LHGKPCIEHVAEKLVEEALGRLGPLGLRSCGGAPVGFMVAFEGLDGSGVSTYSRVAERVLRRVVEGGDYRVVYTKEPTGSPIGFIIWQILRGYLPEGFKRPDVLAHLFAADRLFHLYEDHVVAAARGVAGAVASGYIVVMDRYKYSSIAYQAAPLPHGMVLDLDYLIEVNKLAPPAHILVYLDVDPEEAAKRIAAERRELHLYETRERLAHIRNNYYRLIRRLIERPELPRDIDEEARRSLKWYTYMPRAECVYRGGPWPAVVVVDESAGIEETARRVVEHLLEEALRRELLVPAGGAP